MKKTLSTLTIMAALLAAAPAQAELPVLNGTDWRTSKEVVWSTPTLVRDEFEGDYLAVFDRNYLRGRFPASETGVVSNWSRHYLRLYVYRWVETCGVWSCRRDHKINEAVAVYVKAGARVFKLVGKNGNFAISEELAYALKVTPPGETKIKLQLEGSGSEIVSDIGSGTVQAWKTVYKDASPQ
jgi:hypothetical protein